MMRLERLEVRLDRSIWNLCDMLLNGRIKVGQVRSMGGHVKINRVMKMGWKRSVRLCESVEKSVKESVEKSVEKIVPVKRSLLTKYMSLSKFRLGALVMATTAGGYLIAPEKIIWSTMIITVVGTSLAIASANSMNQYIEVEHDEKMSRTKDRVLPNGELSMNHALGFSVVTGVLGTCLLAWQVNFLAASLALGNIFLYTLVYTPLKRYHWINTWVGAVVGAIPPLIGWAGCNYTLDPGAWVLFYLLFVWQISHFLALSWPLKNDYGNAGYKMLVNSDPGRVATVTFRYSLYFFLVGPMCYYTGLTTEYFIITSTILNIWFANIAYKFYKEKTMITARKTFMATLYYLPIIMGLMILHKPEWHFLSDLVTVF